MGEENMDEARIANYGSKAMLDRYLLRYWGTQEEIWDSSFANTLAKPETPHFALKCVEMIRQFSRNFDSVLDIGCCAGRTCFELARYFKKVVGSEYSQTFVDAANLLKDVGELPYFRKDSGEEGVMLKARIDPEIDRDRVHFEQGDGSALHEHLSGFDAVLFANVLCRLSNPQACLERMQCSNPLVKPGGLLVMTTPFSWLEEYTPKERWISGVPEIQKILSDFELIDQEDIPLLFRDHRRKFDYIVPLATVWRRNG